MIQPIFSGTIALLAALFLGQLGVNRTISQETGPQTVAKSNVKVFTEPMLAGVELRLTATEQYEKAIEDFSKAIELNNLTAVAYNNRGYNYQRIGYQRSGKNAEAMVDYNKLPAETLSK